MHNSLTVFALIILALVLNHVFGIGEVLMNFLLFGIIPYSSVSLSPTTMLALMTLLGMMLTMHLFGVRLTITRTRPSHLLAMLRSMISKPAPTQSTEPPVSRHVISKF